MLLEIMLMKIKIKSIVISFQTLDLIVVDTSLILIIMWL